MLKFGGFVCTKREFSGIYRLFAMMRSLWNVSYLKFEIVCLLFMEFYANILWCLHMQWLLSALMSLFSYADFMHCSVTRGNHLFVFPIHLSEFVSPSPIFYGTVVPLAAYFAIKILIVKPYIDKQQERYQALDLHKYCCYINIETLRLQKYYRCWKYKFCYKL